MQRLRCLTAGQATAAAGAVLLFVALFLPWYASSASDSSAELIGWNVFDPTELSLMGGAMAVAALVAGRLMLSEYPEVTAFSSRLMPLLGGLAVVTIGLDVAGQLASLTPVAWAGMIGALALAAGGLSDGLRFRNL